ncbi:MAG: radical SAM protein [Deltaproteobacteria bacterium]|nr:radical SAM protein [Deltaproteobacteria bacterium]
MTSASHLASNPPPARRAASFTPPASLSFKPGTVFEVRPIAEPAHDRHFDALVEQTRSVCPSCKRILDAELVTRGDDLYMRKRCPEHGAFDLFFSRDQRFVREVRNLTTPPADARLRKDRFEHFDGLRSLLIDITDACNMACPNCITDSRARPTREPDTAVLLEKLRAIPGRKPIVYLIGGEPTLRKDLVPFLATLVREGFIVKLETNGIRLVDEHYCRELKDAGLEVGVPAVGQPARAHPREAARAADARRALPCPRELHPLRLQGAARVHDREGRERRPGRRAARVRARHTAGVDDLAPAVVTPGAKRAHRRAGEDRRRRRDQAHRARTAGQIAKRDFLWFLRALRLVHRLTGNPDYKPRSCLLHLAYYHDGEALVPLNRLLNPLTLLRHWRAVPRLWPLITNLGRIDRTPYLPHLSFVVVEALLDRQTMDFREASNCDKAYLTEEGYSLLCSYNALERGVTDPVLPA